MTEQQRERDIAEMEAQMAHDTDQYFEARPQIMRTRDKETTFEAGFKAAWAARPLSHAEGEAVDHWAVRNPGLADQFRAEAQAVRKRLGFESDADDVSPNDLRERIAEIEGAPQVAGLTETAIKSSPAYRALHREKDHLLGLLKDQAPQVAVPEALTKYDGYVPPEDGSAGEYYVDGWNSCRDAILANSAPAQTVSASVPEQKTWNQAGGREDLRYTEGWNDCRAAMLATAPTAPAGELVTRCTAGLGCDEKGHCDAAATGQGDMCDRRTMAHERPVSAPDGLPEPPFDAAHDARVFADRVEMKYGFRCQAGDIADCYEWQQLRQCLVAMAEYVDLATDERDIAALLERIVPRIDPQNPKPLDESEHCCEFTLYYERERIHGEIARLRKLGGNHD